MLEGLIDIQKLPVPKVDKIVYNETVPIYTFKSQKSEAVQINILFLGGKVFEHQKGISLATHDALKEGVNNLETKFNIRFFDSLGAQVSFQDYLDGVVISIRCLFKYIDHIIPAIAQILLTPELNDKSLNLFKSVQKQELIYDLNHNDSIAFRELSESLFGANHPYGYNLNAEIIENIKLSDIQKSYRLNYTKENCAILIFAKKSTKVTQLLSEHLLRHLPSIKRKRINKKKIDFNPSSKIIESKDNPHWSIKLGMHTSNKDNPKYVPWMIFNNLVGGFYGSRLTKKAREQKGITYDISSQLETLKFASILSIQTEVSPENKQQILNIIEAEIKDLLMTPITNEELRMVKNYIFGSYLRQLADPLNQMKYLSRLLLQGFDFEVLMKVEQDLNQLTPPKLLSEFQETVDINNICKIMVR